MGIFFLFQASLGVISLPADFGLGDALEKRISEGENAADVLATAILLKLLFASVISGVLLLFREQINGYIGADLTLFLVLGVYAQEAARLATHTLHGELRVSEAELLQVLRRLVWFVFGGILVVLEWGAEGLVYAWVSGSVLVAILGLLRRSTEIGTPKSALRNSLLDFSKYSFVTSAGSYVYSWMDVLVIGFFLSQSHVGTYEVAWRIALAAAVFNKAVATTVYPQMSEWDANDSTRKIEELVEDMFLPSLAVAIPAFLGGVILSQEILRYLFGPEYGSGWIVLIVLMFSTLVGAVHMPYGRILPAMDRPDLDAKSSIFAALINMVLNVALVWYFGIIGAAVATAVARLCSAILELYYVRRFIDLSVPWNEIGRSLVAALLMTGVLLGMKRMIQIDSLGILIGMILVSIVSYALLLVVQPGVRLKLLNLFGSQASR